MSAPAPSAPRRPKLVWVITIYFALALLGSIFSWYTTFSDNVVLMPLHQRYADSLTGFDHGLTLLVTATQTAAAVGLFLMRRWAPRLFTINLVLLVLAYFRTTLFNDAWRDFVGEVNLATLVTINVVGWLIAVAICVYSWRLLKRGQLR